MCVRVRPAIMSSAIITTDTPTDTPTLSAEELEKIALKNKILLLDDVLAQLKDQALFFEGVSNSLQAIIDRKNLKRSNEQCRQLIQTVKKFSNDVFIHENEVFTCLQKCHQNSPRSAHPSLVSLWWTSNIWATMLMSYLMHAATSESVLMRVNLP